MPRATASIVSDASRDLTLDGRLIVAQSPTVNATPTRTPKKRFAVGDEFRYRAKGEASFTIVRVMPVIDDDKGSYCEVRSLLGDARVFVPTLMASWRAGEIYREKDEIK